jgi:hypothetical protein
VSVRFRCDRRTIKVTINTSVHTLCAERISFFFPFLTDKASGSSEGLDLQSKNAHNTEHQNDGRQGGAGGSKTASHNFYSPEPHLTFVIAGAMQV